jgi:hypothetical protein
LSPRGSKPSGEAVLKKRSFAFIFTFLELLINLETKICIAIIGRLQSREKVFKVNDLQGKGKIVLVSFSKG